MSPLLLALVLAAAPELIADPRGFTFQVPEGFGDFPGFKPAGNKLYAFGKNLGTPNAITLALDAIEGPPGSTSQNCGKLMAIDRTVNSPLKERWNGTELVGVRMLMTQMFGEVVVFCLDVPVGVTLMVSGKPENEPALREAFTSTLASISTPRESSSLEVPLALAPLVLVLLYFVRRRLRASASRSSR
jgi:hypothetical protein